MRKLFLGTLLIIFLLFSAVGASAATSSVTPLNQLTAINRLSLSIGMSAEDIQAQLDSGKTLEQIAVANGMPASMYQKRIINKDFSPSAKIASYSKPKAKAKSKTVKTKIVPTKKTTKKKIK